jgi:tetratricopeptide (TPR) repeat protein
MWRWRALTVRVVCMGFTLATWAQNPAELKTLNGVLLKVLKASQDPIGYLTPDVLAQGEKAAQQLLALARPTEASGEQWQEMRASAYKVLGWVAIMRGQAEAAEAAFLQSLQFDPGDAAISNELVAAILIQRRDDRRPRALFHMARAAVVDGPEALPAPRRERAESSLASAYQAYHGEDPEGLEKLKALAKAQAIPPGDFTILPKEPRGPVTVMAPRPGKQPPRP